MQWRLHILLELCTHIIIHVFHSHILLRACCNVRRPTYYGYLTCKLDNSVLLRPRRVFSIEIVIDKNQQYASPLPSAKADQVATRVGLASPFLIPHGNI